MENYHIVLTFVRLIHVRVIVSNLNRKCRAVRASSGNELAGVTMLKRLIRVVFLRGFRPFGTSYPKRS